jgi:SagB-type dehydrogenase family enzyme
MSRIPAEDPLASSNHVVARIKELAAEVEWDRPTTTGTLLSLMTRLSAEPNSTFQQPPRYRMEYDEMAATGPAPTLRSSHSFFDVVKARASRRDFGSKKAGVDAIVSVLAWTFGARDHTIAYDWRDAPLRYVASAGGLSSIDAYCISLNVDGLQNGSYYYDYVDGLVPRFYGEMAQKVAGLIPGTAWLARASAVIVLVANPSRVDHKYQSMGAKLSLLDAGVALGHVELVAAALELRSCVLGALPVEPLTELLRLDPDEHVPIATIALGTRE